MWLYIGISLVHRSGRCQNRRFAGFFTSVTYIVRDVCRRIVQCAYTLTYCRAICSDSFALHIWSVFIQPGLFTTWDV